MRRENTCLIMGSFGANNAGDMLILDSTILLLRDVGFTGKILIPTSNPDRLHHIYTDPKIELINTSWKHGAYRFFSPYLIKHYNEISCVISTAGTFFDRHLLNPSLNFILSMWMVEKTLKFSARLAQHEPPKWIGLFVGISQPTTFLGRRILSSLLNSHSIIITRDKFSSALAQQFTIDPTIISLVDAVWNPLLDPNELDDTEVLPTAASNDNQIAINPNRYWESLVGQQDIVYYELISYLQKHDYKPVWYCTYTSDEQIARRINKSYSIDMDIFGPSSLSHRELFQVAKQFQLVVGSRLHGCLIPLVHGIPVIALAYDPKVSNTLMDLGLEKYIIYANEFNKDIMIERVIDFLQDPLGQENLREISNQGRLNFATGAKLLSESLSQ